MHCMYTCIVHYDILCHAALTEDGDQLYHMPEAWPKFTTAALLSTAADKALKRIVHVSQLT